MKNKKGFCVIIRLAILIVVLSLPVNVLADTYLGTDRDDTIYFGYCDSCNDGSPGLLICLVTYGGPPCITITEMDSGYLRILGLGGNDVIKAADNTKWLGCEFGNFDTLTYSSISLHGGDGNDCLFGSSGNQNLYGGRNDDYLQGYSGDDNLFGGPGNDFLLGDKGNDSLRGDSGDDILVGATDYDYIDGGSGRDIFRCRCANSSIPLYDDSHGTLAVTDCGDTTLPVNIEVKQQRDPYKEWAFMTRHWNKITYDYLTTSNPALLMSDRAAGASIIMSGGGDIPVAGDFNRNRFSDDVAVFRPSTRMWYYDHNHDGETDPEPGYSYGPWGMAGDRPVAGDFDCDGFKDDVAVFRPSTRMWYYDHDHDGDTDPEPGYSHGPWGLAGDIPIAGDFDCDGFKDDVAVFRPSTRMWYYDHDHDGDTDPEPGYSYGPWGLIGDIPIAGNFDSDLRVNDVAVFRPSTRMWYYDHNHDGDTDPEPGYSYGPWGLSGEPLHTTHKQYDNSCGFTSLNMVMEYLGLTDHNQRLFYSRGLDDDPDPVHMSEWDAGRAVDVGHFLSMEHIMYEAFHKARSNDPNWTYKLGVFMDENGRLNIDDGSKTGSFYEIQYNIGHVVWDPATQTVTGQVQKWLQKCDGVGCGNLGYVADKYSHGMEDSHCFSTTITTIGGSGNFESFNHLKAVIKGFIDHDIPLVLGMKNGGHYNTLIGYWDRGDGFYIYTADPLDGYGRPFYSKPMRWTKICLTPDALFDGASVFSHVNFYGHSESSCESGGWTSEIDRKFDCDTICG
jgi:hypothetical protein